MLKRCWFSGLLNVNSLYRLEVWQAAIYSIPADQQLKNLDHRTECLFERIDQMYGRQGPRRAPWCNVEVWLAEIFQILRSEAMDGLIWQQAQFIDETFSFSQWSFSLIHVWHGRISCLRKSVSRLLVVEVCMTLRCRWCASMLNVNLTSWTRSKIQIKSRKQWNGLFVQILLIS